jgi:hypothetical protein
MYEKLYQEQLITIGDEMYKLDRTHLMQDVLTYHKALDFIQMVYESYICTSSRPIDFEISIDETDTPTDPKSHVFIALELKRRQVLVSTLAPRFIGEFQKGIDYIGDLDLFTADLAQHAAIADHYGYRLSIHSGSDKFSIFPILQKHQGKLPCQDSGTTARGGRVSPWKTPVVRWMHTCLKRFSDAKKFYMYYQADASCLGECKTRACAIRRETMHGSFPHHLRYCFGTRTIREAACSAMRVCLATRKEEAYKSCWPSISHAPFVVGIIQAMMFRREGAHCLPCRCLILARVAHRLLAFPQTVPYSVISCSCSSVLPTGFHRASSGHR